MAAEDSVAQGLVLLRNTGGVLPLRSGLRVAVLGPQGASSRALVGDCYCGGYCTDSTCFPDLGAAIDAENVGGSTVVLTGVSMNANDSSWGAAIAAVSDSDVVILALGTDTSVAGEGRDRSDGIGLPGLQGPFGVAVLAAAAAAKVPVVLVLLHNLPVSFDELVVPATNATYKPVDAIVDAWAPMQYAAVIAKAIFGAVNRWGKATMTIYPAAYADAISLFEYSMSAPPGRSYKYYDGSVGAPLVRFGEGMSYSTFQVACTNGSQDNDVITIGCNISNIAGPDGDEVLMAFHRPSSDVVAEVAGAHPLALSALVGFQRVSVPASTTAPVLLVLSASEALAFVNEDGDSVLYPGLHYIDISNGNGVNITVAFHVFGARVVSKRPRVHQSLGGGGGDPAVTH